MEALSMELTESSRKRRNRKPACSWADESTTGMQGGGREASGGGGEQEGEEVAVSEGFSASFASFSPSVLYVS